ncbi:MAG: hypothetical protein ACFE7I_06620 [Candidatus Hodarchaeota archaeon]
MNSKKILLPIILATLFFGFLPLATPSTAYVTSPTTVPPIVTVGNPVTGILNQTDDKDTIAVHIASPGLYEIQVKAESINTTQTTTSDIDIAAYLYQLVGTTDPYTDQVIEVKQYITYSFSDLNNLYPGGYAIWNYYAAVTQPGSYLVEIEASSLSGYRAAEYTVSVSLLSSLDDTSATVNANTSIPWDSADPGAKSTYFDVSAEGVYNFTFSQEVPAYHTGSGFNVSITSATFDINVLNFDDSDERVEVYYNGDHIGDIYRTGRNYFPVSTDSIRPGSSDNVTIYYYNLTSPSSTVTISGSAYLHVYRNNGYDHFETWEQGSWSDGNILDFSTDSTWQTEGIYWYVASANTYMDLIDSDCVMQIDFSVVPPFRLTNNETWDKTATSLGYFYLPAGRYYLIWDRDFPRINETTAVLIESISTETLNPGGSVTLSTNDTTYMNDAKGVILNLTPDTTLYNLSASVSGVNWTAWATPVLYGENHSATLTSRVYYEQTTYPASTYYESKSIYDFGIGLYEPIGEEFVGPHYFYPYVTFGYSLLDINGTKSFDGGANFASIYSNIAYLLSAYPTSGTTGNSASASVTLSLSSGETIETISPGQTKTVTGLNYTTGPRYGMFRLPVQVGTAYKVTGTPAAYTSDGQWQVGAGPGDDNDWLWPSLPDAGGGGPGISGVNDSDYFIDVPVRNGHHHLVAVVPGGDTTAINVTVESISAISAPVGTPVGVPLDKSADEKFKFQIVRFNVAAGSRYTIHLRNKGIPDAATIRYIIFDSEGLSPTRAAEVSGVVPLNPAPVSVSLTTEQVFDIVPVVSGPVYIYIDDLLEYGGFVEVEVIGSAVGMGFPLGLAIGLPVGIGVGLVAMFWLNKKGIIGGPAST